ncbi:hypothetical protein AVEN_127669-1 [Araneus ventricosus]|uniref:Uncharacterized protein n=1 Tax=Araneus ventricosus TaxID=182803 RepID=A0A4Y2PCV8_ARAVE|nr:hypothetical protein AVEN_127669-1 [Araneus ventricosus]
MATWNVLKPGPPIAEPGLRTKFMHTPAPQRATEHGGISVAFRSIYNMASCYDFDEDYNALLMGSSQPTLSPARLQLDCSGNVDEEAVEQWINGDLTLECCEVLSDDDIVSRVTCGSEETRNFEECPESDEENLATHQKLSHGDALVHTEALLNYLEQEDESTPAEKMILGNLRSIIRRRINEKQKQTSIISFFTQQ